MASALVMLQVFDVKVAQGSQAPPAGQQAKRSRKLFVDPSASSVAGARANLVAGPLIRQAETYVGNYQLKVRPYFVKSEKGVLQFAASEDSMRKLDKGSPTDFTGKATSSKGKAKIITGRITPSAPDRGTLTCSVTTENGRMVFNTSYHFGP